MNIKKGTFPGCCGIQVLWNFGNTDVTLGDKNDIEISTIDKAISKVLTKGVKDPYVPSNYIPPAPTPFAMTLVALNRTQYKKMHKMMVRKGFKLIDKGWNLNHKDMNYLYSLHLKKGQEEYEDLK